MQNAQLLACYLCYLLLEDMSRNVWKATYPMPHRDHSDGKNTTKDASILCFTMEDGIEYK